jgi:hypothetical protein
MVHRPWRVLLPALRCCLACCSTLYNLAHAGCPLQLLSSLFPPVFLLLLLLLLLASRQLLVTCTHSSTGEFSFQPDSTGHTFFTGMRVIQK